MSEDWRSMSAADLGHEIGADRIDPRELTETFLDAIAAHADTPRIYARVLAERARTDAAAAAERARTGARRGPLDGVPISWKDNVDIAGEVTEAGSKLLASRRPESDAPVFAAAARAGLVCLGKTHMSELAFSGLGVNPVTATPPNAFDPVRAPGGSSSGAAVSVALGLAAAAVGSDTGGSVRIPAAWNGLAGLKTTAGVISCEGVVPLSTTYDTIGPLCRTVEDCALLFAALADQPQQVPSVADLSQAQFLVPETVVLDGCDPEPLAGFEDAVDALAAAGARIARAPVPEFSGVGEVIAQISPVIPGEAWGLWGATIDANPGVMFSFIEKRFRSGKGAAPEKARAAMAEFAKLSKSLQRRMAQYGPILMPTGPCLPPPTDRLLADESFYTERNLLTLRNTRLGNLLTLSALTVPTAAPMCGLMVVGGPRQEAMLLEVGRGIEPVIRAGAETM